MGAKSRRKGAVGEREWASVLRSRGYRAERGRQYHGRADAPDVRDDSPLHWEVKRTETLSLYPAIEQACRDCGAGELPAVAHRRNGKGWLVIMRAEDFFDLIDILEPPR